MMFAFQVILFTAYLPFRCIVCVFCLMQLNVIAKVVDFGNYSSTHLECVFAISILAGVIVTKVMLDREIKELHEVRVSATDGGGLASYTTVRVHVSDQGDHEPMFLMKSYKANVYSTAHLGTSVVKVGFILIIMQSRVELS